CALPILCEGVVPVVAIKEGTLPRDERVRIPVAVEISPAPAAHAERGSDDLTGAQSAPGDLGELSSALVAVEAVDVDEQVDVAVLVVVGPGCAEVVRSGVTRIRGDGIVRIDDTDERHRVYIGGARQSCQRQPERETGGARSRACAHG